jgi:hypothetical protein
MLTRRQRNSIFETLAANGLDPAHCDLEDSYQTPGSHVSVSHEPSGSRFRLWPDHDLDGRYNASMVVGPADLGRRSSCDWDQLIDLLASWASEVRYETHAPDLWTELRQVSLVLTASQVPDAGNEPFTPDEQAEISRRFDGVKQLVRERFELTDEQLAAIDQRLDDAGQASARLGRKDWAMMLYGAVMSTLVTDAVPPNVIHAVLGAIVHGIAHIFGIGGPPPVITA